MSAVNGKTRNQALALAGAAQFALYAHRIAADGDKQQARVEAALRTIFCTDPESTDAVFGGPAGVLDGIDYLSQQLDRRGDVGTTSVEVGRYLGQLLRLAGRLRKNPQALSSIRSAIERARLADAHRRTEILNKAYREHISTLKPQIMIKGHASYLENTDFAECIRTFLLAGIRCAVLWHQNGGAFWRLIFQRRQLVSALDLLYSQAHEPSH